MQISVLMTIYNEAQFVDYAIRSCLHNIDHLVIVEGAYQETIKLGKPARSNDGTIQIIEKYKNHPKVSIIYANETSDAQQRNIGLSKIKELNPNGYLLIIDGDEIYEDLTFKKINNLIKTLEESNKRAAYFLSTTFVNDFTTYTLQEFPRLFKISKDCTFINDNFMVWPELNLKQEWLGLNFIKAPYISYLHFSFCKGKERFETKKKWWETRFNQPFTYSWFVDESGKIQDTNHHIMTFKGKLPIIMNDHPLLQGNKNV